MSLPSVLRDTQILGRYLFDHTPYIRAEIDRFFERFEKNERHREFDGILRANHSIIEATGTPVEALFNSGRLGLLINDIKDLTERIQKLSQPKYANEHAEYFSKICRSQKEYFNQRRVEFDKKLTSH